MAGAGHNNPPPDLTEEEWKFLRTVLDRDLGQSLAIVMAVQKGDMSEDAARAAVAYTEAARPIFKKIKDYVGDP